ncbi:MAG: hypothetical protein HQM08_26665 [Candidatus Riflebacteria bacterium]|nr:hypothetical protein [Candidatus Riflebacteria bacterium]
MFNSEIFSRDQYTIETRPESFACIPILRKNTVFAILYLENNKIDTAFSTSTVSILRIIATQAAISIENAIIYEKLLREFNLRKQKGKLLKKSENFFRKTLDHLSEVVVLADKEDLPLFISANAKEFFGATADSLFSFSKVRHFFQVGKDDFEFEEREEREIRFENFMQQERSAIVNCLKIQIGKAERLYTFKDTTERKKLEEAFLHASEEERRKLGSDLHDGACQTLYAALLFLEILKKKAQNNIFDLQILDKVYKTLEAGIVEVRSAGRGLFPLEIGEEPRQALETLAQTISNLFRVECVAQVRSKIRISDYQLIHIYRIAQEASTNAIRHGQAKRIEYQLEQSGGKMIFRVMNDGKPLSSTSAASEGVGTRSMKYRASILGGILNFSQTDKWPFIVEAEFPIDQLQKKRVQM